MGQVLANAERAARANPPPPAAPPVQAPIQAPRRTRARGPDHISVGTELGKLFTIGIGALATGLFLFGLIICAQMIGVVVVGGWCVRQMNSIDADSERLKAQPRQQAYVPPPAPHRVHKAPVRHK